MTTKNTRQFLFAGYTFDQEQKFKIARAAGQLERSALRRDRPPCKVGCHPTSCDDCPCITAIDKQKMDPLEYLQQKNNNNDPIRIPQYERD